MPATDAARLARAATLKVEPLGANSYRVTGGSAPHCVDVGGWCDTEGYAVWCDCEYFRVGRGQRPCKHLLAVAITQASDEDRAAIAAMLGIER